MKIWFILKSKVVKIKNYNSSEPFYIYEKGAYKIEGNCVNLVNKVGKLKDQSELIFIENKPLPLNFMTNNEVTEEGKEDMTMLEEVVLKNALENITPLRGGDMLTSLWNFITSTKGIGLGLSIIFGYIIIQGLFGGGIG